MSDNKPTLLVVEDDLGLQKQIRWTLDGYDVQLAADRETALNQIRRFEPAVVLLDLGLPPFP
ncbi:MAG: AAA family ATPase, partial [Sulfuriferula sp.]